MWNLLEHLLLQNTSGGCFLYQHDFTNPWTFLKCLINNIFQMDKCIFLTLWHGFSPVTLLHIFRTPFPKNTSGGRFLVFFPKQLILSESTINIFQINKYFYIPQLMCFKSSINIFQFVNFFQIDKYFKLFKILPFYCIPVFRKTLTRM